MHRCHLPTYRLVRRGVAPGNYVVVPAMNQPVTATRRDSTESSRLPGLKIHWLKCQFDKALQALMKLIRILLRSGVLCPNMLKELANCSWLKDLLQFHPDRRLTSDDCLGWVHLVGFCSRIFNHSLQRLGRSKTGSHTRDGQLKQRKKNSALYSIALRSNKIRTAIPPCCY